MNDLGFDIIMGENDKPYYFHKKIKRLYEKLANVIIVTIKQKY